jgi:hypothetical protein
MAGPKLEMRRAQVQNIMKLRPEMTSRPSDPPPAAPEPSPVELVDTVVFSPVPLSVPTLGTETASTSDARRPSLHPPSNESPARRWRLGAALSVAALAGVGWLMLGHRTQHAKESTSAVTTPSAVPPPTPTPVEVETLPVARNVVQLHANARVDSLRVNTRSFSLTPPVADLEFERLADDGDGPLTVVATSVDGRRRATTLPPAATSLSIEFGAFPPRPSLGTPIRPPATPDPAPQAP